MASAAAPQHFEAAVARAVERIAAGEVEKVVLAREVRVHMPRPVEPGAVYDGLRAGVPVVLLLPGRHARSWRSSAPARSCWCAATASARRPWPWPAPAAAAPTRPSTRTSASSSCRAPKDREEQAIVARRIERTLEPVSVWVAAADEPVLVKVQNVQHLATPIRAQLSSRSPASSWRGCSTRRRPWAASRASARCR